MQRTFGTQLLRNILHKWFFPTLHLIHYVHNVLAFCGETSDGLSVNNAFAGGGIDDAWKNGRAVASMDPQ